MNTRSLYQTLPVLFGILFFPGSLQAQYQYGPWVTGSGGGFATDNNHVIISILGQPVSGLMQKSELRMHLGFGYAAFSTTITGIDEPGDYIPLHFGLGQNYPNPFNQITAIDYELPVKCHVSIMVYNAFGQAIAMLVSEYREPGRYRVTFNPVNLPDGVYYYRIKAGEFLETKKMLLLR